MTEHADRHGSPGLDYQRLYDYRFRDVDQVSRQAVWDEIGGFIWRRMGSPPRVLDPAGGRGEFLNAIPGAAERWLVDVVAYPERAVDPGVRVVIGNASDVELPEGYFDGIFVSNLLEHLSDPDAVAVFLARMRTRLRPSGVLAVMGPNFKYCSREYFDCADHILALSHVAVEEHLSAAGFAVTDVVARFIPYSFRSRLPASRRLTRWYLQTPALWRLQGRQFLILGRPA
jgi:SAM-dependent methyltransferase